jgi:dienelactone hydrolase
MRRSLGVLWALTTAFSVAAELDVLPPAGPGAPRPADMLRDHLRRQALAALDVREAEFEKLKTPEQVEDWQRQRRDVFLSALGRFPERTPLRARVTGEARFADYRIEKVIFESQPGFFVTGILYLPLTPGPHPAVVHPTGHNEKAKAYELYQRASIIFARNGIACLCYDPIGQGERRQFLDDQGKPRPAATHEHNLLGMSCALLGHSLARTMIWDGIRAVDYLESRADIDRGRIGCVGISGGGTLTSYLGALDSRIAVAAPGGYLTGFRRLLETIGPQDSEQNLWHQVGRGLDHADYVLMRAPRPTLIMAATRDFFDIGGTWRLFRDAKRTFGRLGFPEHVEFIEADATHGFPVEHRVGSVRWFRRWFLERDERVSEQDVSVQPEGQLLCTPGGQTLRLPAARSLLDLNHAAETKLAERRKALWRDPEAARSEVRRISGIRALEAIPEPEVEFLETLRRPGYTIRKLLLKPEPGILLPGLLFEPPVPTGSPVLYVRGAGKHVDAQPGGVIEARVRGGHRVLAVDLRGMGETARREGDSREWSLAHLLGQSLVGLRAEDVLTSARWLIWLAGANVPPTLVAVDTATIPALHAAAVEPQLFLRVELKSEIQPWAKVVHSPLGASQSAGIVFGALQAYDLPDLVGSLAERTTGPKAPP